MGSAIQPLVSVIVPTKNEAHHIVDCLKSIKNQTYKNIEVIIVDQSSTDNTKELAKKHGAYVINRPAPKFYSPPSTSRNVGAKLAKGSILYHLDADMQLSKNLINEAVELFNSTEFVALAVHEKDIADSFWTKCKAFERRCYWNNINLQAARIVKAEVFKAVGGYDETIESGEDFYIDKQYKQYGSTAICKNTVRHDLKGLKFKKMLTKKYNYGKTGSSYFIKSQQSGAHIVKLQLLSYIRNLPRFIAHPLQGAGMLLLRGLEISFGIAGMRNN